MRLWLEDGPSPGKPIETELPAVPREGELLRTPWFAARRVRAVKWDIDPQREPVLIVDVSA